jgi:hypothetical protein
MGQATTAQSHYLSIFSSIAGIAGQQQGAVITSFDSYYGFEGLATFALAAVHPLSNDMAGGITIQRFGDKLYNNLSISIGAAHRISWMKLGVKVGYVQVAVDAPSFSISQKALVVEMGGIARLSSQVALGAHFYNVTQSQFNGKTKEQLPTVLKAGLSYTPTKSFEFNVDIVKNTDTNINVRAGLEYQPMEHVFLRTGFSSGPAMSHFGAGFAAKRFSIDYAMHTHLSLGWSHHLGITYLWGNK